MGRDDETKLTGKSLVPLGAALAMVVALVGFSWQASQIVTEMKAAIASSAADSRTGIASMASDMKAQLTELRTQIAAGAADRWTASDMERWTYRLEKENREHKL